MRQPQGKNPEKKQGGRGPAGARMKGVLDVTRSGRGFFLNPEGDIPVPRDRLGGALSGDIVEILVTQGKSEKTRLRQGSGGQVGRVINVLERKTNSFVGELVKTPIGIVLRPDDPRVYIDFLVVGSQGAPVGHKAIADVVEWADSPSPRFSRQSSALENPSAVAGRQLPKVKVRSVLGKAGEHETEMRAIIASKGFESDFPKAVIDEGERLYERAWDESDIAERKDFRDTLTITIDPDTAKDYDDAISYKKLDGGGMEIGVHIADVTHFMRPGSILDKEAYKRATSVYLVDRTIPMLPPQLSEDLCSLKPDVDRLTFSAVFTIKNGKVESRWFGKTIIRSAKRFTYEDADEALKDASLPYHAELSDIWAFASRLRKNRFQSGAIMFETDEVKPMVDTSGIVTGFKRVKYTESHQLIEELMLLANREVAGMVSQKLGAKNRVFVYRIHDVPNQEKIQELSVFLSAIGYELTLGKGGATQKDLNKLLGDVKGKPEERLITTATIRSMAKAVYTTKNIGHYGLAFENYAHFTSPIRRYPDVMVHRTLFDILSGRKITEDPLRIQEKAVHASEREVFAAQAERESIKMKQVEYFMNLIGQERTGVISGVTEWGLYIEDTDTGTEGMARLMSLADDSYEYNPKKFAAIGAKTKRVIRLGDPVRYRVEKANLEDRTLDFSVLQD